MHLDAEAIVCAALAHGEHGAVVRFLTSEAGLVAGYVQGGRSRKLRPVLSAGNVVRVRLDSRSEGHLARARVELERSRAAVARGKLPLAIVEWLTGLIVALLPEGHPYPRIHPMLGSVLDLAELQDDRTIMLAALARFELLLLAELGFGLDLSTCAATGQTHELAFVSPKTGRAVSAAAGQPYSDRLFRLPALLMSSGPADAPDVTDALRITRHFVERNLLAGRRAESLLAARDRIESGAAEAGAHD